MMNNMSQGLGSFNNMMPQNNMGQQNPYGQQMNPQMMGQQMRSPEMFSEQLMEPNQMNPMQDPMQGLQPMAEPEGFGVYGQSLEGFADGGAALNGNVPRETMISGQPHMLAYINPEEEQMLYDAGGSGRPGPGGIPAFVPYNPGGSFSEDGKVKYDDGSTGKNDGQAYEKGEDNIVPLNRPKNLTDNSKTSGIMSVVNDVKAGFKNLIEDVGMTYAGGFGSFSDLSNETKYKNQYDKLVDAGYSPNNVADYLDTTLAGQTAIRKDMLDGVITDEERAIMKDERLADEAKLASTAVGTGIDTIPISTSLPFDVKTSFAGKMFEAGGAYSTATDAEKAEWGVVLKQKIDNGAANENEIASYEYYYGPNKQFGRSFPNSDIGKDLPNSDIGGGGRQDPPNSVMQPPGTTEQRIVEQTFPDVGSPNAIGPTDTVAEKITPQIFDPVTPVGGNFALPGQQNFGPTPSAALNFNPNTYMQTPQNANVALGAMFKESDPYTFEELLSMYKPAYEPIL